MVDAVVLVVDDDSQVRGLTEAILKSYGYQVVVAADGQEGIRRLSEDRPDLIVLDLNMPVMDGWRFCAERQRLADRSLKAVPILLLTGEDDAVGHADALRAAGCLEKPVDPDDLLDAVSSAMGRDCRPLAPAPEARTSTLS
jgi:two-component system, chemotaxis family, chemotaxis protein CheY